MQHVIIEPGSRCQVVTPDDSNDLNVSLAMPYARKLRILTSGNLVFVTTGGDTVTYTSLTAGTVIDWVSASRVKQTGTTCTLEAIY